MRVLLLGGNGLLGRALSEALAHHALIALDREALDIGDETAVRQCCTEFAPEVIVNAAAYNAVDEVERTAEAARQAFAVNDDAVRHLTTIARERHALLVHFSTDYVFDGEKNSPYIEDDHPQPLSIYGRSKLAGEEAVRRSGEQGLRYYLIRTSRLFGPSVLGGKKTFVDLVLEMAATQDTLNFVDSAEISSPTYAGDLASAVYRLLQDRPAVGIYHRTNDGAVSWYGFAEAILEESGQYSTRPGVAGRRYVRLVSVGASDVPRPARRPRYSVLQSTKLPPLRPWREALREYLTVRGLP